jgi:hypothetical protein
VGVAATGALAQARKRAAARAVAGDHDDVAPYWFYVNDQTALYGLTEHDEIVAQLTPGTWYLARATYAEWVHARDDDRNLEGFVAAYAITPADTIA